MGDKIVTLNQVLNNKDFENEFDVIIINDDIPVSFTKEDYNVKEGEPQYTDAEKEGRSGSATAVISPNTLAVYTNKYIKRPNPLNWTTIIDDAGIYNRSHIIGYKLSAKNLNPNNLFIGTEYLNQITMKSVEKELHDRITQNGRTYLYKVTPIYFKKDTVPYGVLMEAETINDNLEKDQFCRFCYNIQDGVKINYYDGGNEPIEKVYGTLEESKLKIVKERNEENNKYKNYSINVRTSTFHLMSKNCCSIKNIEKKYIQETRAAEDEILSKGFKLCKRCN